MGHFYLELPISY